MKVEKRFSHVGLKLAEAQQMAKNVFVLLELQRFYLPCQMEEYRKI